MIKVKLKQIITPLSFSAVLLSPLYSIIDTRIGFAAAGGYLWLAEFSGAVKTHSPESIEAQTGQVGPIICSLINNRRCGSFKKRKEQPNLGFLTSRLVRFLFITIQIAPARRLQGETRSKYIYKQKGGDDDNSFRISLIVETTTTEERDDERRTRQQ